MTVQVRLFAGLRELAGAATMEIELPPGGTVADAYAELRRRIPGLPRSERHLQAARNQAFCAWDEGLAEGDEIAFLPPVSGGTSGPWVEITGDVIDVPALEARVRHPGAGAICTFTGQARDHGREGPVTHLEYEAYQPMAEAEMRAIAETVMQRWPEARVAMAHRVGRLDLAEASVVISISCPHRAEAFEACRWAIDQLKAMVPIWKKEFRPDGSSWIEERS